MYDSLFYDKIYFYSNSCTLLNIEQCKNGKRMIKKNSICKHDRLLFSTVD